MPLNVISAGAAKGVVEAISAAFEAQQGSAIAATFGAVGAMREKLLGGAACDAIILTQALLDQLASDGYVRGETIVPLGRVRTGIAVRNGDEAPAIEDADALKRALLAASAIFFPDPERATAGIHFMQVLERLGIRDEVADRLRPHPNGATAMAELARSSAPAAIGCTQVTEINYTPGVVLVGTLPKLFELATLYSAAVCARAANAALARRFVERITGATTRELRIAAGFEEHV